MQFSTIFKLVAVVAVSAPALAHPTKAAGLAVRDSSQSRVEVAQVPDNAREAFVEVAHEDKEQNEKQPEVAQTVSTDDHNTSNNNNKGITAEQPAKSLETRALAALMLPFAGPAGLLLKGGMMLKNSMSLKNGMAAATKLRRPTMPTMPTTRLRRPAAARVNPAVMPNPAMSASRDRGAARQGGGFKTGAAYGASMGASMGLGAGIMGDKAMRPDGTCMCAPLSARGLKNLKARQEEGACPPCTASQLQGAQTQTAHGSQAF